VAIVALAATGLGFLALPVVALLLRAIQSGALGSALAGRAVLDALTLSLASTAAALLLIVVFGLPLAFVLARASFRGKAVAEALVDLPIVMPPSVAGLALLFAFGRNGLAGPTLDVFGVSLPFTTPAVVVAQVFVAAPFFVRAARAGFRTVETHVEEAARIDGATESAVLRRITLPLAAPALGAGLVLAWSRALGEFGATILFAGNLEGRTQTLPLLVYSQFQDSLEAALAASTILVLAAFGVLVAVRLLHWPSGGGWPG
jgi:molybdate transport system permease protein